MIRGNFQLLMLSGGHGPCMDMRPGQMRMFALTHQRCIAASIACTAIIRLFVTPPVRALVRSGYAPVDTLLGSACVCAHAWPDCRKLVWCRLALEDPNYRTESQLKTIRSFRDAAHRMSQHKDRQVSLCIHKFSLQKDGHLRPTIRPKKHLLLCIVLPQATHCLSQHYSLVHIYSLSIDAFQHSAFSCVRPTVEHGVKVTW